MNTMGHSMSLHEDIGKHEFARITQNCMEQNKLLFSGSKLSPE